MASVVAAAPVAPAAMPPAPPAPAPEPVTAPAPPVDQFDAPEQPYHPAEPYEDRYPQQDDWERRGSGMSALAIGGFGLLGVLAIAVGATYLLLLTGSTVVGSGADEACHSWPLCGAGFSPDFSGVNAFTMLHRGSVLLIGLMLVIVLLVFGGSQGARAIKDKSIIIDNKPGAGGAIGSTVVARAAPDASRHVTFRFLQRLRFAVPLLLLPA